MITERIATRDAACEGKTDRRNDTAYFRKERRDWRRERTEWSSDTADWRRRDRKMLNDQPNKTRSYTNYKRSAEKTRRRETGKQNEVKQDRSRVK